jgi:hypothetical protein
MAPKTIIKTTLKTTKAGRGLTKLTPRPRAHSAASGRGSRPTIRYGQRVTKVAKAAFRATTKRIKHQVRSSTSNSVSKSIAAAICIPGSCPNLRIKSSPGDSHPTAAVSLHNVTTQKQPSSTGTYPITMPVGTSFVALFRDPFRSAIVYQPNPTSANYTYVGYFRTPANVLNGYYTTIGTSNTSVQELINPIYFKATSSFTPHGVYLYPGFADGTAFFWVDYNATVTIVQSIADTAARAVFGEFDGEDEQAFAGSFAGSTTVTFTQTVTTGAYMSIVYISNNATPVITNLTVSIVGSGDSFGHWSIPNVINHLPQLTRCRINSLSVMTSPVAAALNRGGTITAGDVEGNLPWYTMVTTSAITNLPTTNYSEKDFMVGLYAFLKPADISELAMRANCSLDGTVPSKCAFDLRDGFRYIAIVLNSDVVGAVSPGMEFLLTFNWDIEYQTSDQWFETHAAPGYYMDTVRALELVSPVPVFHDNPLHWSDIKSALAGGYNFMRKHARKIGGAIGSLFPFLSGPAHLGGEFMSSLPEL